MTPTGVAEGAANLTVFVFMFGAVICPVPLGVVTTPVAQPGAVVGELNVAVVANITEEEPVLITELVLHD